MSMTPIEAAAKTIALYHNLSEAQIAEVITRHLFPVVKPEDVVEGRHYWFTTENVDWDTAVAWKCDEGDWRLGRSTKVTECEEIRGPIPQPEVRS